MCMQTNRDDASMTSAGWVGRGQQPLPAGVVLRVGLVVGTVVSGAESMCYMAVCM